MDEKRVAKLEVELEALKPQIRECLEVTKVLTELKVIVKQQVKHSEKMDTLICEQSKTLVKQGEVLVAVHEQMQQNNEDIKELKSEINALKGESTIMTSELVRYVLFGGLGALVTYVSSLILK